MWLLADLPVYPVKYFQALKEADAARFKMNKCIALILIPCLVAFVVAQYPGYGHGAGYGVGGYGSGYGLSNFYYNYGNQQQEKSSNFALLISGLLLLFAFNITGTLTG
ncbi:uncharacterized protein LOC132551452 [Ylistrum balloti]|uniref:uncharacterized protein LOC132551452 n=1 Tax=Ylistrum balloti TaxID=509963 RepID=UPI002905E4AA|nr:uncharacterized protein LOC132551452 [Ylistrum balloti]